MSTNSERPSISELIARAVNGAIALVKAEIDAYKTAIKRKLIASAVAIGLFCAVGLFAVLIVVFLFVAAYQALTLVFAGWLAALIIVGALVILAGILAFVGTRLLKKGSIPPLSEPITNVKDGLAEGLHVAREHPTAFEEEWPAKETEAS